MEILNNEEIHLKFLLGQFVHVEGIGDFHSPLLSEIVNLTEAKYNESTSALLFDKASLESEEVDDYTNFQIVLSLIYNDEHFRNAYFNGLRLHYNKEPQLHEEGYVYFDESRKMAYSLY